MRNKIIDLFKSKMLTNSIWLIVLQVFNTVIPLVTLPYITRVLGTENYGFFSLALNWITYFQVVVEYGFGFTGARKVSIEGDANLQELYSRIITARLLLLSGAYVIMNIISVILRVESEQYISMNILFLMILGIAFQLTWLFQGKQDMTLTTIVNAISRLMSVVFFFLFVKKSEHLYIYSVCYAITFILSAFLGVMLARKKYGLKIRLCKVTEAFAEIKDGWYLFISQAMAKIFSGIGITILGIVATSSVVGIYSAIYKIPYIMVLFFSPIGQAIYPHISIKFSQSFEAGKKTIFSIARLIVPLFAIVGMLIILLRQPIIMLAFGNEYLDYAIIIIPLVFWMLFSVINNFLGVQFLVASGKQEIYSKAFTISSVITVGLNLILGLVYGIYGISIAAPAGEFVLTILLSVQISKINTGGKI